MAVGIRQKFTGGTQANYDAAHKVMEVDTNPPAGMLVHSAGPVEGGWGIIDFWESREDFDAFARRIPEGMAAAGVELQGPPDIKEFPVHEMIHP